MSYYPTESEKKGFFIIPNYSTYAISENGVLYNRKSKFCLGGSKNNKGYIWHRVKNDEGVSVSVSKHRLMAITFIGPPPVCIDGKSVVNHLDGDKTNNHPSNLEWTTYKGNVEHAGAIGLTTKCIPMVSRNVYTGEICNYPSATECARVSGLTKDAILYRLKNGKDSVYPEGQQYAYVDDVDEWQMPSNPKLEIDKYGRCKKVCVNYLLTGEILEFSNLTKASEHLKVSPSTITGWLSKKWQPVLPGYILIKLSTDETPWRVVDNPVKEFRATLPERAVEMTNVLTGDVKTFNSLMECADYIGKGKTTVHYRAGTNGTRVFSDNCTYRFLY